MEEKILDTPGKNPEGLVWVEDSIWLIDSGEKILYRLKRGAPHLTVSLPLEHPKSIAWNGTHFYIADDDAKIIVTVQIREGKTQILNIIKTPSPTQLGFYTIEGIAYSDDSLWLATSAGNSSTIFELSPKDGSEKNSFFCDSYPRGLASDGRHLWSICYNGEKLPSLIDERIISEDPRKTRFSRIFLKPSLESRDPKGLTFDGENLFVADGQTRAIYRWRRDKA